MWDIETAKSIATKGEDSEDIRVRSLAECLLIALHTIAYYKHETIVIPQRLQRRYAKNLSQEGLLSENGQVKDLAFYLGCAIDTVKYYEKKEDK